jgi:hypothetical protein
MKKATYSGFFISKIVLFLNYLYSTIVLNLKKLFGMGTTLDVYKEYKSKANEFIKDFDTWINAVHISNDYKNNSDYSDVKKANCYYESVSFYKPENESIVYNFSMAGIKLAISKPEIDSYKKSIILKIYRIYIDLSLRTESKELFYEIKELTLNLKDNTIGTNKINGKIVPAYLDAIANYLES